MIKNSFRRARPPWRQGVAALALTLATSLPLSSPSRGADARAGDDASPARFGIGTTATAADVAARNIDIMPDGEGLPPGSGSVEQGRAVYEKACLQCHGVAGEGGAGSALAGGESVGPAAMAADRSITHTIGNYWPWATTLFDYTRRAMPYDSPGSLSDDDVYAVTAYMLYLNELVEIGTRLDARTLAQIRMPAHAYFRPDRRGE